MIDYDGLWNEIDVLVEEEIRKTKLPEEKSLTELSKAWRISKTKTKDAIDKLVESGKLRKRMALCPNGKMIEVYAPIEKAPN